MQKNSNRKGLALGAIFALVASLFATAPAAQANEAGLVVEPIVGTSYTMVNTEDFILSTRLGSQVQADRAGALKYIIEKSGTVGYGLSVSHTVSASIVEGSFPSVSGNVTMSSIATASTLSVVAAPNSTATLGLKNQLRLQLWTYSGVLNSVSPEATVTVTAFLDLNGDNLVTGTEPATKVTISFVKLANIGASVVLTQPVAGDTVVTASAKLSGVNHQQLSGTFNFGFLSTRDGNAANANATVSAVTGTVLEAGNYSASEAIASATASALVAQSISAALYYGAPSDNTLVVVQKLGVSGSFAFDGVTFSGTVGDNFIYTGSNKNTADVRVNSTVNLEAWAYTGSKAAVSATQGSKMWFETSGSLSTERYIVVNGVTYTDSAKLPTESSAITITAGAKAAISLTTFGFANNDTVTFRQKVVDKSASIVLTTKTAVFTVTSNTGNYAIVAPGVDSTFGFEIEDQFGVASSRVNQRLAAFTFGSGFSNSATVSSAVVAGKASVAITTLPAAQTGSATARITLQAQNVETGTWENLTNAGAQVNIALVVTTSPAVFSKAVAPSSSPVSISYDVYSWSGDVTVTTNVAGAVVTVTSTGLVISDETAGLTASNTITARSGDGGVLTLKFAGKKAGKYTVSYSVGSTTTTSQVVVQEAVIENASTINFDKSSLNPGETNVVVGTLVDANGNPIESNNRVDVVYTGKGLPFNVGKDIDTDEDGKFTFQVLVLAGETGAGVVTATVRPTDDTDDNITVAKTLNIVAPAAPVVPEVNAVIGTFNGRWAVRVENAKGSVVTVKVGGNWFKYTSLNENYLFSRKSVVGRSVAVAVYVNGTLENVATITIK